MQFRRSTVMFMVVVPYLLRVWTPTLWKVPSLVFVGWFSATIVQFSNVLRNGVDSVPPT